MKACRFPSTPALKIEQRYFTQVLQTTEAFSMIRSLFISMQELSKGARRPAGVPKMELKKVGVVGAGFMGASIAYVTAAAGFEVVLIDRDIEAATRARALAKASSRIPSVRVVLRRKRVQHFSPASRPPPTTPI